MKRIFSTIVLLLCVTVAFSQEFKSARMGIIDNNGSYELSIPSSTIDIEVLVEMESITPGVYARYSQKYLALRTPLIAKTSCKIVDASISLSEPGVTNTNKLKAIDAPIATSEALTIDQLSSSVLPAEEAAKEAAKAIFTIRRQRRDLVSGDAGENYFGAGLATAIATLDAIEAEYLKLFTGEKTITQTVKHFTLTPKEGSDRYIIARFNSDTGLLPASDLSGAPIYLHAQVAQSLDTSSIEANEKTKDFIWFRIAVPTICTLFNDSQEITSTTLSLYEYGKSIKVATPERR